MAEKCTHLKTLLSSQRAKIKKRRSESEAQKASSTSYECFPHFPLVVFSAGIIIVLCGTKQLQSANWWETQWCGNCFCVSISPSRLPYSGKLNFRRRKLSHEFRGFVAIREFQSFLREILGLGVLWRGKREQSAKVFSFFHQFAKVFSLDSFPLYGIPRGGIVNRETKRNGRHTHKFAVCLKCTAIEVGYSVT